MRGARNCRPAPTPARKPGRERADWVVLDQRAATEPAHALFFSTPEKQTRRRYRSGHSRDWIKSKNPAAPAVKREAEEDWGKERGSEAGANDVGQNHHHIILLLPTLAVPQQHTEESRWTGR